MTTKEYHKQYAILNKERIADKKREYYKRTIDHIKEYKEINKDKISEYRKTYSKKYYEENKGLLSVKQKIYNERTRDKRNERSRNRRLNDPLFKLKQSLRNFTHKSFRLISKNKNSKTENLLGISYQEAKIHIENQFKEGMSWENYGKWHIDHIIPLSSGKTEEDLKKLCNYKNLQPLWAEENLKKCNKVNN